MLEYRKLRFRIYHSEQFSLWRTFTFLRHGIGGIPTHKSHDILPKRTFEKVDILNPIYKLCLSNGWDWFWCCRWMRMPSNQNYTEIMKWLREKWCVFWLRFTQGNNNNNSDHLRERVELWWTDMSMHGPRVRFKKIPIHDIWGRHTQETRYRLLGNIPKFQFFSWDPFLYKKIHQGKNCITIFV